MHHKAKQQQKQKKYNQCNNQSQTLQYKTNLNMKTTQQN